MNCSYLEQKIFLSYPSLNPWTTAAPTLIKCSSTATFDSRNLVSPQSFCLLSFAFNLFFQYLRLFLITKIRIFKIMEVLEYTMEVQEQYVSLRPSKNYWNGTASSCTSIV